MRSVKFRVLAALGILLAAFAAVNLGFLLLYRYDNKYTAPVPQPESGRIDLRGTDWPARGVVPLIDGWEYYGGALLSPAELREGGHPFETVYIGQFANFARGEGASPYGCATYRLEVLTEPEIGSLSLELPEIFSAMKVWVNGEAALQNGALSPEGYRPHIRNRVLSIPSGRAELVIQVENHSLYYSGITYPPLLGSAEGLSQALLCRALFYGFLCFFSLGAAAVSHFLWLNRRQPLYLAFALLALSFALRVCYPFIHWLGLGVRFPYILEDTAYYAGIVCMAAITRHLCRGSLPRAVHRAAWILSLAFLPLPAAAQMLLFPLLPQAVAVYGWAVSAGKLLLGLYLLAAAAAGCIRGKATPWLLAGNAVFAAGLLADYATAGQFEPIRFGWQDEYAAFLIVLLFCGLMVSSGRRLLRENQRLTADLQKEVEEKTRRLSGLLEERKRFLSSVAHDLKAPVAVIRTYTSYIRQEDIAVDDEVKEYLDLIERKSGQMESSLSGLQLFSLESSASERAEALDLHAFLEEVYADARPYADANGIYFHLRLPRRPARIRGQRQRLARALENILLNATEYTPPDGTITLSLHLEEEWAAITVSDTGTGIPPDVLPHVFEYRFSTSPTAPGEGTRGLGLYFARITAEELGGSLTAASEAGRGAAFIMRLPLLPDP